LSTLKENGHAHFLKNTLVATGSCIVKTSVNQVRVRMSANHMLSATYPLFREYASRICSVLLQSKLFRRKKLA